MLFPAWYHGLKYLTGNELRLGETLYSSEYLQSANGTYFLQLQNDGDLVLYGNYDGEATQVWSSGTGMNCIKIGLPGKLILSMRKVLREVLFS